MDLIEVIYVEGKPDSFSSWLEIVFISEVTRAMPNMNLNFFF